MIENLEHRLLMRRGGGTLDGRTLTISGTAGDDNIWFRGDRLGIYVSINGRGLTFSTGTETGIRRIVIWGGAGNDTIDGGAGRYPNRVTTKVAAYIDGGAGDDHLYSTRAADTLLGSTGNDFIKAGAYQNTYMDGGAGDDRLYFGGVMHGGRGTDVAVQSIYNETFVSGLERLYEVENPGLDNPHPQPVARSRYKGDLRTENGRLVFSYPAVNANSGPTLTTPAVGLYGMLEITLGHDANAPQTAAIVSFDPDEAERLGIILTLGEPGAAYNEQTILLPNPAL
ncbi:MAG: calcium-binding protein [Tepidisphaeraceae bacterium]